MALLSITVVQILLIGSINAFNKIDVYQPAVCLKKKSNAVGNTSIDTLARDFKNFVRNSDIFVDKSLLVNIATRNVSFISLTYPHKWGKTINLDMVKTFLEIEVDSKGSARPPNETWAYKFFKYGEIIYEGSTSSKMMHPPMIAKNERVLNSYLSRYPVIYLDLSSFNPITRDFEGFLNVFKRRIAAVFRRHDYIVDVLRDELDDSETSSRKSQKTKTLLEKFKAYKTEHVDNVEEMITSLKFLSSVLKSHFDRPVYILIDDYDALVLKSCLEIPSPSTKETKEIIHFFHTFLSNTIETNENARMVIVTGILDPNVLANRSSTVDPTNYNWPNRNIHPFHGFTVNEVKQLLTHCFVEDDVAKEAMKYYNGYRINEFPEIVIYDPWSVVNFVNTRKIGNYRTDQIALEISRLVDCEQLRYVLDTLSLHPYDVIEMDSHHNMEFNIRDLILLKNIINGVEFRPDNDTDAMKLVFTYLYTIGYFTPHVDAELCDTISGVRIGIPNEDLKNGTMKKLKNIFAANDVAKQFLKYFQYEKFKDSGIYSDDKDALRAFYKTFLPVGQNIHNLDGLRDAHLYLLTHRKLSSNYNVSFNVSYKKDNIILNPYAILQKNDHRVIIEFECGYMYNYNNTVYNQSFHLARKALNRAKKFNTFFDSLTRVRKFNTLSKREPSIIVRTTFMGIGVDRKEYTTRIQVDNNPKYED